MSVSKSNTNTKRINSFALMPTRFCFFPRHFNIRFHSGGKSLVCNFPIMNTWTRNFDIMKGRLRLITRQRLFSLSPFVITLSPFDKLPHLVSPSLFAARVKIIVRCRFLATQRPYAGVSPPTFPFTITLIQPLLHNAHPPFPYLPLATV